MSPGSAAQSLSSLGAGAGGGKAAGFILLRLPPLKGEGIAVSWRRRIGSMQRAGLEK
jgi:hypothetical protein